MGFHYTWAYTVASHNCGFFLVVLWLHQADLNMNRQICTMITGAGITPGFTPTVMDTYANTASAGSIIAFHKYNKDLKPDSLGIICSFGAGYSVGNIIVRKIKL
jgi:beta-ketodecanoyl-[acyl-carrier-protein] synthase